MFKKLCSKVHAIKETARRTIEGIITVLFRAICASRKAEGYVDTGVKILIAVVIGALVLAGLYTLFNTIILPTVSTKVTALFNYTG